MQRSSLDFEALPIRYAVGTAELLHELPELPPLKPFDERVIEFLNAVSKDLLRDPQAKAYPDVVTLAFWMRRASTSKLKQRFDTGDSVRLGRGMVFHIAPSNVAVNYAYSLVTGLLCGNANVVRLPSKEFPQIDLINTAFSAALERQPELKPYVVLVRYGHDAAVNDAFSSLADVRVIWGGDNTIAELRRSPLKPRGSEITFADRYSAVVIDSEVYMASENKAQIAMDFWNDTYLTDQNACTSPRVVLWLGSRIEAAKEAFWTALRRLVERQYEVQGVQAVNKLTSRQLLAAAYGHTRVSDSADNRLVRVQVPELDVGLLDYQENSGFFLECDGSDVLALRPICQDLRLQTISYIGSKEMFAPLLLSGIRGVDRIVPVGKTMDFDFLWDGYNLFERLTRSIAVL